MSDIIAPTSWQIGDCVSSHMESFGIILELLDLAPRLGDKCELYDAGLGNTAIVLWPDGKVNHISCAILMPAFL